MIIVNDLSDLPRIANPSIRTLVAIRLQQLQSPDDLDSEPVELIIVEPGDSALAIQNAVGFQILTSLDDLPFDHPDYTPPTEFIERHTHDNAIIFELFIVASDSGVGTAIFVTEEEGIDADLLSMLREFSTPAVISP